ncbi:type VI secretion system protein ImpE [Paraburkholderia sp. 35.1]
MTLSSVDVKPEKLLADGHLNDALQALAAKVKNSPADATLRVFLFQLLALRGDWERAGTQLTVAGELERQNALMVAAYRAALVGEREREAVLAALRNPATVGERSEWERLLLQSLQQLCGGRIAEALALRARAFDEAETVRGSIDGVPFKWIADADPRFGPCLEVILKDSYAWVPFSRVAALSFDAPTDLRDKIWATRSGRRCESPGRAVMRRSASCLAAIAAASEVKTSRSRWQSVRRGPISATAVSSALVSAC